MNKYISKFLLVLNLIVFLGFSNLVSAATGDAGCGLGSLIFQKNSIISQELASTTNASSYSQGFGITTGTSNCKANGIAKADKSEIFYVESNFQNLKIEMAKGQGETLNGFAQILGCSPKGVTGFGSFTRSKFEKIIPSEKTTPIEMLERFKSESDQDPTLSKECQRIANA